MLRRFAVIGTGLTVAALGLLLLTGAVFAEGPGPFGDGSGTLSKGPGPVAERHGPYTQEHGPYAGDHGLPGVSGHEIAVNVAAELTGLTPEEIGAELAGGKTLPVLLEEKGIALEDFQAAVRDAHQEAVEQALAEGHISQERAERMLERMTSRECERAGDEHGPGQMGRWAAAR